MNKSWQLIPKIISGEKKIESRWYQTKRAPWDRVHSGDLVFFKNSGEPVIARAEVAAVLQFEIGTNKDATQIINDYGTEICLVNSEPSTWGKLPKYCILIGLKNPQLVDRPFRINKLGFGTGAAWLLVEDIESIME